MKVYIHKYASRLNGIENAIRASSLSEKNKKIIFEFKRHLVVTDISMPRVIKYLQSLKTIASKTNIDFDKATKNDIEEYVAYINGEPYSEWTKKDFKLVLKRFYKWLKNTGDDFPPEVKWIKTGMKRCKTKLPEELLTPKDVMKMIDAAENLRDKALVSVLFESGCRIGELGILRIKDLVFDDYGIQFNASGKTGARQIRIIDSTSYLSNWLNAHPCKNDRDAFLWVSLTYNKGHILDYNRFVDILKSLAEKAGVQKKCNPHAFRHARATFLANHLTEFQMNQYFGWAQGSDMPSTYVHLSGKNTDCALLKLAGIKTMESKNDSEMKPKICSRCNTINPYDAKFCIKCACVLDLKTAFELEEKMKKENEAQNKMNDALELLTNNPEFVLMLANKMKEMRVKG
jgi:integrase/recombinase XerD